MDTLIFDFDGTLVDSLPIVLEYIKKLPLKQEYKKSINAHEIRNRELSLLIKKKAKLSPFQLLKYVRGFKALMQKRIREVKPTKGILPTLKKLAKKYELIVLSSNSKENIEYVIKKNKLPIKKICSDSSVFGKAHVLNGLIKNNKLDKKNLIYIGDETRDIDACKKIGIKVIAVSWGYNSKELLQSHNPDYLIESPPEMLPILKSIQ